MFGISRNIRNSLNQGNSGVNKGLINKQWELNQSPEEVLFEFDLEIEYCVTQCIPLIKWKVGWSLSHC
jgi:hypothetical protein